MKRHFYYLFLLVVGACQSPQKAFDAGEYDKAFKKSVAAFQHQKGSPEIRTVMRRSAEQILQRENERRNLLYASDDPSEWEKALYYNEHLQKQLTPALPYLEGTLQHDLEGLQSEYLQTRALIYQAYIDQGIADMAAFDSTAQKALAQEAYFNFESASAYTDDTDQFPFDSLLQLAQQNGTLLGRLELDPPFFYRFDTERGLSNLEGQSGLFYNFRYNLNPGEADCIIQINFSDVDFDEWEDDHTERHTKEVIVRHETETDTSGNTYEVPVYEEVSGSVEYTTHHIKASLSVSVNIINQSGQCTLSGHSFSDWTEAEDEAIEISGDDRAIPSGVSETTFSDLPSESDLAEELIDNLCRQIIDHLR